MNKKGSFTVFAMIFMVSLISLLLLMIGEAKKQAVKGAAYGLGLMWCDSILAEYDLNLYDRYDIMAYHGLDREVREKLDMYAGVSFYGRSYINYQGAGADLRDYSLLETENFREQVVEVGKLTMLGKMLDKEPKYKKHGDEQRTVSDKGALFRSLPSEGRTGGVSAGRIADTLKGIGSFKDLIKGTGESFCVNEYLMIYFNDLSDDEKYGDPFLGNEIEYMISGKHEDGENAASVKRKIIAVREVFNLMFVLKDPRMRAETLAMAELLTPGPTSLLTQKILQAGWALAESYNDYKLLINNKKVPLYKNSVSWALDLGSIIQGGARSLPEGEEPDLKKETPLVDPGNTKGEKYSDYLRVMLFLMDEETKLLRAMDLIQINMRSSCYGDFMIRDYNVGLKATFKINGKKISMRRAYHNE